MSTSDAQRRALALMPKFTGMTSVICSILVAYSILRDVKKRSTIHYRLILATAVIDMINSMAHFMSTWPIPKDSGVMYAIGNEMTCNVQGFFTQFTIVAPLYNAVLGVYYLLVLRYGWTENRVQPLESYMHTFPIMFGLNTAVMGISLKLYNNSNIWCWIAPFPAGCEGDNCIRGENADFYRWTIWYGPAWVAALCVLVSMLLVFEKVLQLSRVSQEGATTNLMDNPVVEEKKEGDNGEALLNNDPTYLLEMQRKRRRVRRDMAIQCILYGASFAIVWVWLTSVRILQAMGQPVPYKLLATAAFMTPFQGFFNFLAFIFPRYFQAKESNPQGGVLEWIKEAL